MSARCHCHCGCNRLDRELDDVTSSQLTCKSCNAGRHWEAPFNRCPTCQRYWDAGQSGPFDPMRVPAWAEAEGWHKP